jgi:ATP-dependent protease ClpP protease subunit
MQGTVYLVFHDTINDTTVNRFIDGTTKAVTQHNPMTLYFLFSSNGGFINPGVALYHYLKALPQETIMHNAGGIDSVANAVFLAGKRRYAAPASSFLLHGVSWTFGQGASLNYPQMQEVISQLDAAERLTARIMGEHTKLTEEEVRALFRQGESKDPEFAREKGMIHDIRPIQIEPGAPVHKL